MDIALIGYGKMGKVIEKIALDRGHKIVLKIGSQNLEAFNRERCREADVAIEFSHPGAAVENIKKCLEFGLPVACGTTGWLEQREAVEAYCREQGGRFLYASNFSIGVNIFFEINARLARLMNKYTEYEVEVEEVHHTEKLDRPSGTALTLTEQILENLDRKTGWSMDQAPEPNQIPVRALREDAVPGTHHIRYQSPTDAIEITHTAHNRNGFATGAVLAAEFLFHAAPGSYSMRDVLL